MVYEDSGLYLVLYFYRMLNVTNNYFFSSNDTSLALDLNSYQIMNEHFKVQSNIRRLLSLTEEANPNHNSRSCQIWPIGNLRLCEVCLVAA